MYFLVLVRLFYPIKSNGEVGTSGVILRQKDSRETSANLQSFTGRLLMGEWLQWVRVLRACKLHEAIQCEQSDERCFMGVRRLHTIRTITETVVIVFQTKGKYIVVE